MNAQEPPPTSEKAKKIEALVNKAAALIESKGKAIFPEFRKKDSEWFYGDTYLFVYDLKSNVLLNAAFPAREGTNTTGQKDASGKLFHHEFIQVAEIQGIWMGRLHVPETRTDSTVAEMGLREGG